MFWIKKTILIFIASLFLGAYAKNEIRKSTITNINMKILVLSTVNSDSIIQTLQSYNIPYDFLEYDDSEEDSWDIKLYTEDGQPKYSGIVLGNGSLSYYNGNTWGSILTTEKWNEIHEYQVKYGIRIVALDESPNNNLGTEVYNTDIWGTSEVQTLKMVDNEEAKSMFKASGLKEDIPLDTSGLYHTPVIIKNDTLATPILTYQPIEKFEDVTSAVVLVKNDDGAERLSFYLTFGAWSINSVMLNHLWVSWITRSLFTGYRRVLFTPHIDDVFITTGRPDLKSGEIEGNVNFYRSTPEDFDNLAKWQKEILHKLPEGSFICSELAFNGNGVLSSIDYDYSVEVDGERYVDLEYKKEPGTGKSRWPIVNYTLPYDKEFLCQDPLFKYFTDSENQKNFFWSSHTYSHENLDDATTSDVDNEIRNNIEIAKKLGVYDQDNWSGKAIITPQISGLKNVDAIKVLLKYGIISGTGDLSRPTIINNENPYLPWVTTMESSNYDGFPVVPRSPTEIYYSSSTPEENVFIYNEMYEDLLGKSTWDDILKREADRALLLLMKLRGEAYQFHQINIRSNDQSDKKGLLQKWFEAVIEKYNTYVDWPVKSLKLNDLAEVYMNRYHLLNDCDVSQQMIFNGTHITNLIFKPNKIENECLLPVTIPQNVVYDKAEANINYETLGKENLLAWIRFEKGDTEVRSITLNPPLPWKSSDNQDHDGDVAYCWSEEKGVRCCNPDENIVEAIDEEGWWGMTNDENPTWCGIIKNEECWSTVFGIPCCETENPDYIHENGVLGYEMKYDNADEKERPAGGWCGLKSQANRVNIDAKSLFSEGFAM